ncbi:MAG TPA: response regulator [Polyangiales bacterium]|nr:response regulator [Polyangiales bacterium]
MLLVDDEPQVLVALEDLLSDDFQVLKANSAHKALELLRSEGDIAVLVTDQRMPRMTGDELLATLEGKTDAQRIMVTGFADLQTVIRAVNSGKLFAYVTKPWNPGDLRSTVERAAEQFQKSRQLATDRQLLHKQTAMLNAILEGLAEGVVVTDESGNFLLCNREAERLLGVGANTLSVLNWTTVCGLYEADNKTPIATENNPLAQAIAGAELTERELCVRSGDELRSRVMVSATPLHDESGEIVGGIGLLRDVTDQREMEQRLVQAQKMDAIGRLAGGVAHDFNNLLSVIQSCGDLLLRSLQTSDPKRTELGHILNAAQRAALLTRQLLSFSRQQVVQPKVLQINEVVRSIETMLHRVIGEHISVVTQLDDDLGLVHIDASQLEQVILNLVVNGRDAMPNGGRLYIETRNLRSGSEGRVPPGDYVMLVIRDTGSGMGPETQRKMFEPFFTTKDLGKGSGLGLSTVYGIVEQHGGHIRYQTAPNAGTTFEIYWNRVHAAPQRSIVPSSKLEPRSGFGTILLVEDEDSVRRVAAAILRNHGYTVLEARRPSDALEICSRTGQPIDLLLTDVVMPESSGPQLAAELLRRQPDMGVMYMSGYSGDNALMGKALRDGITFLQKPFTPALLTEAVSEALPKRAQARAVSAS